MREKLEKLNHRETTKKTNDMERERVKKTGMHHV